MSAIVCDPPFPNAVLRRSQPLADECLPGYLLRVAAKNAYADYRWFLKEAGMTPSIWYQGGDLGQLSKLLAVNEKRLQSLCSWPVTRNQACKVHHVGTSTLHRAAMRPHEPKFCPQCLADDPHHRGWWGLAIAPACPTHKVRLLDHCTHCGVTVTWNRSDICLCPTCGRDYRECSAEPATEGEIALSRQMLHRLGFQKAEAEDAMPTVFSRLSADHTAQVIYLLGGYAAGLAKGSAHQLMARATPKQVIDIFADAGGILLDWPEGFYRFLDEIRKPSSASGLEHEFGAFYRALKAMPHRNFDFLHEAFSTYIRTRWNGGFLTRKNRHVEPDCGSPTRYLTRAEAAAAASVRPETIEQLIASGRLSVIRRKMGKRLLTLVDRDDLSRHLASTSDLLTAEEAGTMLGLSKAPMRQLLAQGLLRPAKGPRIDGTHRHLYRQADAEGLLRSVLGGAPLATNGAPALLSFDQAIRRITPVGLSVVDLLQEILRQRLVVQAQDEQATGLKRALFSEADINVLRHRLTVDGDHHHTLPEAAITLGLKQEVLYQLVSRKLLVTVRRAHAGRSCRMIADDELRRFSETYVSAVELAIRLRTSPRHAVEQMQERGLHPVTGPSVDGGRQWFFLRTATC